MMSAASTNTATPASVQTHALAVWAACGPGGSVPVSSALAGPVAGPGAGVTASGPAAPVAGSSAALFTLLAPDAEGGARERLQARLADGFPAGLTHAVGAGRDPGQRPLVLRQQVPGVVRERQFLLALVGLGRVVGRIVPSVSSVPDPVGDAGLSLGDLGGQPGDLGLEPGADLVDFGFGPGVLTWADRESGSTGASSFGHRGPPWAGKVK